MSNTRLPKGIAAILVSLAIGAAVGVGCRSYPEYPDVLWACDNRRSPWEPQCSKEDRGEDFMTIGFYESVNGPLILRLRDQGEGVFCKITEIEGRWAKIELTTGRVGYVNFDEPLTTTTSLH